nr:Methyltransferase-like protein 13 [Haemonchus contortus]
MMALRSRTSSSYRNTFSVIEGQKCIEVGDREVEVGKMCNEKDKDCYTVFIRKMEFPRGRWLVVLYSLYDGRPDVLGESFISLTDPQGESIKPNGTYCVDLKDWKIDRRTVVVSYIARMIAAPFIMNTLSLNSSDSGKQVLEIGLGGGTFDMGLHELKPDVNITAVDIDEVAKKVAFKYFGVEDSKNHHSVIEDGVKFVDDAKAKGRKFDVVAIDACDDYYWLPCPGESLRSEKFLTTLKEIMTDKGTLTVNFLSRPGVNHSKWHEGLRNYQKVFPTCFEFKGLSNNFVLICVPYKVEETLQSRQLYKERVDEVMSALNLTATLQGYAVLNFLNNY